MMDYWIKQTSEQPTFPDLLWSRPERRDQAGKLLVVGGNKYGFSAPASGYTHAVKAGIGTARVVIPNSLQRTVQKLFPQAEYAASTPSGSFASSSLGELLDLAAWSDGVLFAGDLGRNSETAVLLEAFLSKHTDPITLVGDALDHFVASPQVILSRPDTTLVLTMATLQKLVAHSKFPSAFTQDMGLVPFVRLLHEFSKLHAANVITCLDDTIVVAVSGNVSTTPVDNKTLAEMAAYASVWWIQHPTRPFEALTTAAVSLIR